MIPGRAGLWCGFREQGNGSQSRKELELAVLEWKSSCWVLPHSAMLKDTSIGTSE